MKIKRRLFYLGAFYFGLDLVLYICKSLFLIEKYGIIIDSMTVKTFIAGIIFCALMGIVSWVSILINVDPTQGAFAIFLFYLTLAVFSVSLFTLIGFFLRKFFSPRTIPFSLVGVSFRQAVLLSVVVIGTLLFQNLRILSWWSIILLVGSVVLMELYFISR